MALNITGGILLAIRGWNSGENYRVMVYEMDPHTIAILVNRGIMIQYDKDAFRCGFENVPNPEYVAGLIFKANDDELDAFVQGMCDGKDLDDLYVCLGKKIED